MSTSADRFWRENEAVLAEVMPQLQVQRDNFYSQPDWDVYQLHYTSADGMWLFSWLSVPKGDGPFPVIVRMPDYGSVHDIVYTSLRDRVVVMNPTYRGQRRSDHSIQAKYPGLLTEGIGDASSYVMRRVFVDVLRAVDVLYEQNLAKIGKMAVIGAARGQCPALAFGDQFGGGRLALGLAGAGLSASGLASRRATMSRTRWQGRAGGIRCAIPTPVGAWLAGELFGCDDHGRRYRLQCEQAASYQ